MNQRERVSAALNFECPDRLPRDLWGESTIGAFRRSDWEDVIRRFPPDIRNLPCLLGSSSRECGEIGNAGVRVDAWGSEWTACEDGVSGEVTRPAIAHWSELSG